MTARDELSEVRHMNMEISALQEQMQLLRHEAEGVGAMRLSDMPKGGISKDMSDTIARLVDMEHDCYRLILSRLEKRERLMIQIAQIEKSDLRTVLIRRYIIGEKWEAIAMEMDYDLRSVFRLHGEALQALEEMKL